MKNKKLETTIMVIVFIVVLILSFSFAIEKTKENTIEKMKSPVESITILDNKIELKENQRTYNAIVDCSKITEYTELIDYRLRDKSYKATVNTSFYNNAYRLDYYEESVTDFEIYFSLTNDEQEVLYRFNLTCGV